MANITQARKAVIERITAGGGKASTDHRKAAFDGGGPAGATGLIEKVTKHAYKVKDEDIAEAKAAGFSEDQIFELVICAAVGQANRQLENALAALDEATKG